MAAEERNPRAALPARRCCRLLPERRLLGALGRRGHSRHHRLSALYGAIRGLIVQVASIVGLLGGLYLAERNYKTVRDFLEVFAHRDRLVTASPFLPLCW